MFAAWQNPQPHKKNTTAKANLTFIKSQLSRIDAERLSSRGRTKLRYTQVVDEKLAGSARVQRFVRQRPSRTTLQIVEHTAWWRRRIADARFQYDLDFTTVYDDGAVEPSYVLRVQIFDGHRVV